MTAAENPYEALRLDPSAPPEEVVRQAGLLRRRAADEEVVAALRRAVQALTGPPEERQLHALLAHPAPRYHRPALDAFAAAFRRPPQPEAALAAAAPDLDFAEVTALLRPLAAEELDGPPLPFEPTGGEDGAEEVRRQTAEGLWQALPFDPRA
jgi:hypothetical protein